MGQLAQASALACCPNVRVDWAVWLLWVGLLRIFDQLQRRKACPAGFKHDD